MARMLPLSMISRRGPASEKSFCVPRDSSVKSNSAAILPLWVNRGTSMSRSTRCTLEAPVIRSNCTVCWTPFFFSVEMLLMPMSAERSKETIASRREACCSNLQKIQMEAAPHPE